MLHFLAEIEWTQAAKYVTEGGQLLAVLCVIWLIWKKMPKTIEMEVKRHTGYPSEHNMLVTIDKKLNDLSSRHKRQADRTMEAKAHIGEVEATMVEGFSSIRQVLSDRDLVFKTKLESVGGDSRTANLGLIDVKKQLDHHTKALDDLRAWCMDTNVDDNLWTCLTDVHEKVLRLSDQEDAVQKASDVAEIQEHDLTLAKEEIFALNDKVSRYKAMLHKIKASKFWEDVLGVIEAGPAGITTDDMFASSQCEFEKDLQAKIDPALWTKSSDVHKAAGMELPKFDVTLVAAEGGPVHAIKAAGMEPPVDDGFDQMRKDLVDRAKFLENLENAEKEPDVINWKTDFSGTKTSPLVKVMHDEFAKMMTSLEEKTLASLGVGLRDCDVELDSKFNKDTGDMEVTATATKKPLPKLVQIWDDPIRHLVPTRPDEPAESYVTEDEARAAYKKLSEPITEGFPLVSTYAAGEKPTDVYIVGEGDIETEDALDVPETLRLWICSVPLVGDRLPQEQFFCVAFNAEEARALAEPYLVSAESDWTEVNYNVDLVLVNRHGNKFSCSTGALLQMSTEPGYVGRQAGEQDKFTGMIGRSILPEKETLKKDGDFSEALKMLAANDAFRSTLLRLATQDLERVNKTLAICGWTPPPQLQLEQGYLSNLVDALKED